MSPVVAYHASYPKCRESIRQNGLLPNRPSWGRPYGVYVYRDDEEFDHVGWNSDSEWCGYGDVWEAAYIGPMMIDQYVLNGMIFLGPVTNVALVTGNNG